MSTEEILKVTEQYGAHNYHPLPIVISKAQGVWVEDPEGNRYMDCLSAYSALNQGHRHPRIIQALIDQAHRCTLTSRAFHNDKLGPFMEKIAKLSGMEMVLPMNTGAEAVETAVKAARKWGYTKKKVAEDQAHIIVCKDNFHGRTTTIVSFSTEEDYRRGFGPFTPGFTAVDYGSAEAFEKAITPNTVAFLVEPIQGEAGVIVPPDDYFKKVHAICKKHNILLISDEIQTGLGRTGKFFCTEHYGVKPDAYILGKALGGGVLPISAVVGSKELLGVFKPGEHGSTFGGNPLACAVAIEALNVLVDEKLAEKAHEMGSYFMNRLGALKSNIIESVRGKGLLVGIVLKPEAGGARKYCEMLKDCGVLCKETHCHVLRFAPPLMITKEEVDWAFEKIRSVLEV